MNKIVEKLNEAKKEVVLLKKVEILLDIASESIKYIESLEKKTTYLQGFVEEMQKALECDEDIFEEEPETPMVGPPFTYWDDSQIDDEPIVERFSKRVKK